MPRIEITTAIAAPIETVFDLARSIDAHPASQARHGEKAVAGKICGLIEQGEEVTWEAVHFGLHQRLTSRIVAMQRPRHFRDSMVHGAFQRIDHDHFIAPTAGGTEMKDIFDYTAPFGLVGQLADRLFLERYMRRLLEERNQALKAMAEAAAP